MCGASVCGLLLCGWAKLWREYDCLEQTEHADQQQESGRAAGLILVVSIDFFFFLFLFLFLESMATAENQQLLSLVKEKATFSEEF